MKHLAAYALLVLGGNESPTAADVTKLLKDAGVEADKDSVKTLISKLDGQNLPELIAAGYDKFAAVGSGSGGAAPAGGDAGAADAPAEEKKKEEEPEEEVDVGNMLVPPTLPPRRRRRRKNPKRKSTWA